MSGVDTYVKTVLTEVRVNEASQPQPRGWAKYSSS